ncbi:MAG: hypothetical protein V4671_02710 [Armatimonadota bacterium]
MPAPPSIKVFRYIEELDAFLVTKEFAELTYELGLADWHPVVWLGRLFRTDNDVGEHWFDNWGEREALESKAKELGIDSYDLMVVVPERFAEGTPDNNDGPCHSPEIRKIFWTDVLKSLALSYDLLFSTARFYREQEKKWNDEGVKAYNGSFGDYNPDNLEAVIDSLQKRVDLAEQMKNKNK